MRRLIPLAGLLLIGSSLLGASVFSDPSASASAQRTHKAAQRTGSGPQSVVFTNGSGMSTGNTVKIDPANNGVTPIAGGGGSTILCTGGVEPCPVVPTATASALQIVFTSGNASCQLLRGGAVVASFFGPAAGGDSRLLLALSRPVTFDEIALSGGGPSDGCSLSWIGNTP
jgi:hypothetical protein